MRYNIQTTGILMALSFLVGCSSEDLLGADGTGGTTGSGGAGTPNSGGAAGIGGEMGSGGSASTGGSTSSGGTEAGVGSSGGAPLASGTGGGDPGGSAAGNSGGSAGAETGGTGGENGGTGGENSGTGGVIEGDMPLVYDEEFTGDGCPMPVLVEDPMTLPEIEYHPDPFLFADGTTRMTSRSEWQCRRAEIKATLEKYDAGLKPGKPENVEATLSGNTIEITVTEGGKTLSMSASIDYADGTPSSPVPAIIGVTGSGHSLPGDVFSSRGIAQINFDPIQVMAHTGGRTTGSFYKLYPDLADSGNFIRWAWAVSRLIDALELLPDAQIDLSHLAVSGCSYAGKLALFAGAWDERIALTIPHESGGGGTISWRYSDMLEDIGGEVENLHHAQGAEWYAAGLKAYAPSNVSPNTLPYDHHELIGMIAPRAVLAIESSQIYRMGGEAAYAAHLGARKIWDALGCPDRHGSSETNTGHCTFHRDSRADLEAFVDKFLMGDESVDTDILKSSFTVDDATWNPWEAPELE